MDQRTSNRLLQMQQDTMTTVKKGDISMYTKISKLAHYTRVVENW